MKLASVFSDHAILQREAPIPIWGWTAPKANVEVKLGKQISKGVAGIDGKFLVRLPPMKASGPFTLEVSSDGEKTIKRDIWIGEVWLASGQSNMQFTVNEMSKPDEAEELGKSKDIRMINIPNSTYGGGRQADLIDEQSRPSASWIPATKDSVLQFSAVGAHFAKFLADSLGVKVGIINSSWGGTIIEAWTSRETLVRNPTQKDIISNYEDNLFNRVIKEKKLKPGDLGYLPSDPGNDGVEKGWANVNFDDSKWGKMNLPSGWTRHGFNFSGVFWFRKTVIIPKSWVGKDIELSIGAVDKTDISYFNGEQIGATGSGFDESVWNIPRKYKVPGKLVKAGRNVIAVRAYSFKYDGGMIGSEQAMSIAPVTDRHEAIKISGEWKYEIERNFGIVLPETGKLGPGNPNTPYMLFDNMIAPLLPYAIRGAIWYQGCSNADKSSEYERLLRDMIRDWRHSWGQGEFPFYIVQLANFLANKGNDGWMGIRDAQLKAISEPNTGLAVAIDIGDSLDIHPKNKREVGRRLSLWALNGAYGKHVEPSGPLYESLTVKGNSLVLRFSHIGGGLVAKGGELKTFSIAGGTRKFVPAKALIDGETVVVSSPEVKTPIAVRYAWAEDPLDANLYNKAGLPASPFRTDTW